MKKFFLCILILALTGCATTATPESVIPWRERQLALQKMHTWQVRGSLSIATPDRIIFVNYQWQQNKNNYTILLSSPMDLVSAELIGNPNFVTLKQSQKSALVANSPDALVETELGWQLPITPLSTWIRGIPASTVPYHMQLDTLGRLKTLDQAGWHILFLKYTHFGNADLPTLLELQRTHLRVKLKVQWQ